MKIIGAGLGRTGTTSLKLAVEYLINQPCYHMSDVFQHPSHIDFWQDAADNKTVDWQGFFSNHGAALDWPVAAFWPEMIEAFPDALVLLSEREPDSWWKSVSSTIVPAIHKAEGPWRVMMDTLFETRFTKKMTDGNKAMNAFIEHNKRVLDSVPPDRLVRWKPGDGWQPLCDVLGMTVPDTPFPHANTKEQFRKAKNLDISDS